MFFDKGVGLVKGPILVLCVLKITLNALSCTHFRNNRAKGNF